MKQLHFKGDKKQVKKKTKKVKPVEDVKVWTITVNPQGPTVLISNKGLLNMTNKLQVTALPSQESETKLDMEVEPWEATQVWLINPIGTESLQQATNTL